MKPRPVPELPFGSSQPPQEPRALFDAAVFPDPAAPHTAEYSIPMRDGVELAADVHFPAADKLPAPAVVVGTPYDKSSPLESRVHRDIGDYVVVVYDVRGRGKSEGEWRPRIGAGEDGYDVLEWVAAQEWCTGDTGVTGHSFGGYVAWATAVKKPASLKAIVTTGPVGRMMEEVPYTNGCFWLFYISWWSFCRRRIIDSNKVDVHSLLGTLPVRAAGAIIDPAGPGWDEYLEHDHLDEYWRAQRLDGFYDFDVPALHVGGWHDREDLIGTYHHYEQMLESSPARDLQWLLIGPWSHVSARYPASQYGGVEYPDAVVDMDAIHLRFFDRFLRGIDNGVDEEPRVNIYDPGRKVWRTRASWRGGTEERRLYLGPDGQLGDEPGGDGSESYRYDPLDAPGIRFDTSIVLWEPPLDLGELEMQDGVLIWTSAPLAEAETVRGQPWLELFAATDGEDTDWHVKLADVDPGGRSLQVAWGCLRASHGRNISAPEPVVPGKVIEYSIWLTQVFHTFGAGHRIRIVLASSDYPWFARNLNRFGLIADQDEPRVATNTVHRGQVHPSCLRLPFESDGSAAEA